MNGSNTAEACLNITIRNQLPSIDEVSYELSRDKNIVTLIKNLDIV